MNYLKKIFEGKSFLAVFLFLFVFVLFFLNTNKVFASDGSFGGGDGSSGSPYQIEDCLDLQAINNSLGSYYILNNDIDCATTTTWNSGAGFTPLGNGTTKFTGVFDGNEKTVSDLYINRSDLTYYVGLFGYVDGSSASVTDLGLINPNITGNQRVGGLAGQAWSGAVVSRVFVIGGSVSGSSYVGGLIGWRGNGLTENAYASTTVTATSDSAGGLLGAHLSSTAIDSVYSSGYVTAPNYVGGLIGQTSGTENVVNNAFSAATVVATNINPSAEGAVVGRSYGYFTNTYWYAYSGAPSSCAGYIASGNTSGCSSYANVNFLKSFSYNPMPSWDFVNVWDIDSSVNDGFAALNWQITDLLNPTVSTTSPADDSSGNDTSMNLSITFDEVVATGTGNISIYETSGDSLFEAISVSSSQVSGYNSSTITINPSSDLIAGTDYYVLIDATAIDDTSGNSFAGIASKTTWNFTASDLVAPTLSYLSPGDNATDVAVDAIFEINFSEAIATGTGNIVIYKSSDDSIAESIDISGAKVTASGTTALLINPTLTLEGETEYYIIIPNTAVDDLSANSYAGITASSTWSFTTVDNNNPGVSYFNPQDNSSSVALNQIFEINFNETIVVGSGNIVLYKSSDDSIVESIDISGVKVTASGTSALLIDPAATLESETEYYFIFPATGVDDTSGNSFVGISASSTWSFTSGDYSNPTLSYLNPNDNATAVEIDAVFEINFNEAIATGTGNIVIYKTSDDSVVESIAVGSSKITASGTTALLINPATDLSYETEYYIIIPATAIDDTSGNSYAGITASSTWSFTSKDTPTCPTVSHAATYNPYPTCGVATCESGYTLSNGSCIIVSSGSGGSSAVTNNTTTVGSGSVDTSIPAQKTKEVGRVETSGINAVMHLDSKAIFQAQVSKTNTIQNHGITIKEMDLNLQKVHILIESDPIEFDLSLYETKLVDLDGDGINDIEVTFANLVVNNSEITIKELNSPVADNIKNDNSVNSYIITDDELYERLKGKIILKVEGKGEAYYISSTKKEMYYLGRPSDAFEILRNQGIGITNEDLLRISEINSDDLADFVFCKKHLGKIFLQVEQNGEAWYVNPANEKRYYLGQPTDAFNLMKNLALGISNKDFAKLIE